GGARTGVRESQEELGRLQTVGDLYSRGLADAYAQGMQGFQMDTGIRNMNADLALRGAQAMATMPGQEAQLRQDAYNRMLQTGALGRELTQAQLDAAYQDYLTQRDWAQRALAAYTGTGLTGREGGTTTEQQNQNVLTMLAGAAAAG